LARLLRLLFGVRGEIRFAATLQAAQQLGRGRDALVGVTMHAVPDQAIEVLGRRLWVLQPRQEVGIDDAARNLVARDVL
jgi:hypothetical protein